jgi:predicted amidohydrolase
MFAACLQLRIDLCNSTDNARRALNLAKCALNEGAEILVFPELFLTGFCYESFAWEDPPFPILNPFRTMAKDHSCLIIGSLMSNKQNLGFCLDSETIRFQPKIHSFDQEKEQFRGGDFIAPMDTKYGKIGLEICYDLRFPEMSRSLSLKSADILVTIAQFPLERLIHWRTLCLARAIENQIPHIACNWANAGGSIIIDAWGNVLAEAGSDETSIIGNVDLEKRNNFRREIPCFRDRRPEAYR